MNGFLLGLVSIVYVGVAINYFFDSNNGMGIVFISYAIANIGLYIAGSN